jgi:hypothetical protein
LSKVKKLILRREMPIAMIAEGSEAARTEPIAGYSERFGRLNNVALIVNGTTRNNCCSDLEQPRKEALLKSPLLT